MQNLKNNLLFKLALCALAVCCVVMIVSLQLQYNRLKQQKDILAAEITEAEARIEAVQDMLDMPFDHDYVIRIAREKLNLRLPEEIVFYNDLTE